MFLSSMLLPLWVTYIYFSIEVLFEKVSKMFIITQMVLRKTGSGAAVFHSF